MKKQFESNNSYMNSGPPEKNGSPMFNKSGMNEAAKNSRKAMMAMGGAGNT